MSRINYTVPNTRKCNVHYLQTLLAEGVRTLVAQHQVTSLAAPAAEHVGTVLVFGPLAVAVVVVARLANAHGEEGVTVHSVTGFELMGDL